MGSDKTSVIVKLTLLACYGAFQVICLIHQKFALIDALLLFEKLPLDPGDHTIALQGLMTI